MRAYSVLPERDCDWHVVVVAANGQAAKALAWRTCIGLCYCEYIDLRVQWLRSCTPPANMQPQVFETCCDAEHWMCAAWDYDEYNCRCCDMRQAKLRGSVEVPP